MLSDRWPLVLFPGRRSGLVAEPVCDVYVAVVAVYVAVTTFHDAHVGLVSVSRRLACAVGDAEYTIVLLSATSSAGGCRTAHIGDVREEAERREGWVVEDVNHSEIRDCLRGSNLVF